MDKPSRVQITECSPTGDRRPTHQIAVSDLLSYAREHLPAHEYEQLRNDLTVLGTAKVYGEFGRWFEYEMVD